MEVRHYDKSKEDGDEAPKFNAFIRRNATQETGGDFLVLSNHNAADNNDNEADKNPSKTKIPIHIRHIITELTGIFVAFLSFMG